jgi:hypothetical protein
MKIQTLGAELLYVDGQTNYSIMEFKEHVTTGLNHISQEKKTTTTYTYIYIHTHTQNPGEEISCSYETIFSGVTQGSPLLILIYINDLLYGLYITLVNW